MFIVGYLSYAANKTSIIEIRIRNPRVFNSSDLKRPEAVQIAEKKKTKRKTNSPVSNSPKPLDKNTKDASVQG